MCDIFTLHTHTHISISCSVHGAGAGNICLFQLCVETMENFFITLIFYFKWIFSHQIQRIKCHVKFASIYPNFNKQASVTDL